MTPRAIEVDAKRYGECRWRFEGEHEGLALRALLNGVPLWEAAPGMDRYGRLCNEWLRPEKNEFAVMIGWPAGEPFRPGVGKARLRLSAEGAGVAGGTQSCADLAWPPAPAPERYPGTLRAAWIAKGVPSLHLWSDTAELPTVAGETRREVSALVESVHQAFATGATEQLIELFKLKFDDQARAYATTVQEEEELFRDTLGPMMADSAWGLMPLAEERLEFYAVADNRLLWVTGPGRAPVVRARPQRTFSWAYNLYLARIAGRWCVLR